MEQWVTNIMEQFGYVGILLMMALECIFPPIPSEIVLPFGGFMTISTGLTIMGVIVTATTGSVLGAVILYGIGRMLGQDAIEKIVTKWGYLLRVQTSDIQNGINWFDRYGYRAVFICRMIPLVRSLISIPAGIAKMNMTIFLLFTLLGSLIWNVVLVLIGVWLGSAWRKIIEFMNVYATIIYIFMGIGLLILFVQLLKRNK
ncbi:DedA family protein [Virgibacillus soli]|uniref:DedA family protein n=1 Tax=Paracerasibacillus soli TaxID=480284 RepID=A0ABU5CTT2_9BACI|nr:DedA family protein [Virgibacillus soli]MDY0408833.1 DedA family protein [Virgibacillus soli]